MTQEVSNEPVDEADLDTMTATKETLEDYTLRFAPRSYRKWSTRVVGTAWCIPIGLGLVLPPIFAIATKGRYYLRRTDDGIELPMLDEHGNPADDHLKCHVCHHDYERPDMMKSAVHEGFICSLCLATDKTGEHVLPAQT